MFKMLRGYKTYMSALGIIIAGIAQFSAGDFTGGILHILQDQSIIVILSGFGLGAIRSGLEHALLTISGRSSDGVPVGDYDQYLYVDENSKPISKAQYNKALKDLGVLPVMGFVK